MTDAPKIRAATGYAVICDMHGLNNPECGYDPVRVRIVEDTPENIEAVHDAVSDEIPNPAWDSVHDVVATTLRVLGLTGGQE